MGVPVQSSCLELSLHSGGPGQTLEWGPKGMSRGCRSIPYPATQTRTRPLVLPLSLSRTQQPPPPARFGDPDFFSRRRGVRGARAGEPPSHPHPWEAEPQVSRPPGVLWALSSLRLRLCSRSFREWVLVIRSFILPDVHSPTSAPCQTLSWDLGSGETTLIPCLYSWSSMVPWEAC